MKYDIINICSVKTNVHTVKSTNECVVIIKKYLYCKYVIMYSKKSNVSTVKSCTAMYKSTYVGTQ